MDRKLIIEQYKRFSESCLWRMQRDYFDKAGIDAWVNQVPFYITSNPYIANFYAEISINFISDWISKHPEAKNHPFYILELGTGSGRFSYYVLKRIHELKTALGMTDISICYVMSDFTKNNIRYYESHSALKFFIEQGFVDFALFDMEVEKPITLIHSNVVLSPETLVNPLITFANYIFDTVSHDAFSVKQGKLYELLLSVSTPESNLENNKPVDMSQLSIDFKTNEIKKSYYNDPDLDNILEQYRNSLSDSNFLFPIGSIRAIKLLKKLSNNKLMILSSDKGYSTLQSLDRLGYPSISFHGSFSMMVNFHAIANYFKNSGGDYFLQTPRKGIKTSLFLSNTQLDNLTLTKLAVEKYIEGVSAADYFTLHRRVSDSFNELNLETIAAHLNFTGWDPHIYLKLANRITKLVEVSDLDTINFLASNMHKLAKNYYYMPKSDCILFEIAVFFHAIKRFDDALNYYLEAQEFVGEQFGVHYNLALCQHNLGNTVDALDNFKIALRIDPNSKEAQEWITYIEKSKE
ncbi:MAG: tetratricopeptide repeat protein [Gammaproteobacteria bacterium]|nr:tetratricopeptide repeat protein [Gammaproteobacteria bacterium]